MMQPCMWACCCAQFRPQPPGWQLPLLRVEATTVCSKCRACCSCSVCWQVRRPLCGRALLCCALLCVYMCGCHLVRLAGPCMGGVRRAPQQSCTQRPLLVWQYPRHTGIRLVRQAQGRLPRTCSQAAAVVANQRLPSPSMHTATCTPASNLAHSSLAAGPGSRCLLEPRGARSFVDVAISGDMPKGMASRECKQRGLQTAGRGVDGSSSQQHQWYLLGRRRLMNTALRHTPTHHVAAEVMRPAWSSGWCGAATSVASRRPQWPGASAEHVALVAEGAGRRLPSRHARARPVTHGHPGFIEVVAGVACVTWDPILWLVCGLTSSSAGGTHHRRPHVAWPRPARCS